MYPQSCTDATRFAGETHRISDEISQVGRTCRDDTHFSGESSLFKPGDVLIQKFGGSSVASPERLLKVAERLAHAARAGRKIAVVVSAMGDTTDDLISLMHAVNRDPDLRELDQLMATGELVSCSLLASALTRFGVRARSFNALNLQIETDDRFGSAEILHFRKTDVLARFLEPGSVAVVAGFQGLTSTGELTTLGRGGSDITAVALARELGQRVCEKLTDEDGIYTADPRVVPSARKVWHLDYDEMETLACYGNGILHPRAIEYARRSSMRIHVRSSFSHDEGTVIGPDGDLSVPIKSIAGDKKQAVVSISGIRKTIDPRLIGKVRDDQEGFPVTAREWRPESDGEGSLRVGFKYADAFDALPTLWREADRFEADDLIFHSRLVVISVVGCGLKTKGIHTRRFLTAIEEAGIRPLLVEHDGLRLTIAVSLDIAGAAMEILHRTVIEVNNVR
ncbi:MAG: aspartate kinase [Candidatus Ozemobacteraceae bacterium]